MKIGLIHMISSKKHSKPTLNRVQNSTFWALIRMQEPDAPQYALLEVAAPLQEGRLPAGPRLDPEAKGDRNGA